jgi:hypothetical protein
MEKSELIRKFRSRFDKNFMTPNIVSMRTKDNRVVELSSGTGLEDEAIYGVTIRDFDERKNEWIDPKLSKMFFSEEKAKEYIKKVV